MSRTPKDEAMDLMNMLVPFAEKMLREHGEFYPCGGERNDAKHASLAGPRRCSPRRRMETDDHACHALDMDGFRTLVALLDNPASARTGCDQSLVKRLGP